MIVSHAVLPSAAIIDFGQNTDVVERKILVAGAMFADMTVWEKKE
jgi:hypothetical protein